MFNKSFSLHILLISLAIVFLLAIFWPIAGALDQQLIKPFIDPKQGFIYKNAWWYKDFAHHDLKIWQELILLLMLITVIFKNKLQRWLPTADAQAFKMILIMGLISTVMVSIFKYYSSHSCPWDILSLEQQYITFLPTLGDGGCFPGGHASLGYLWCAGFFAFYHSSRKRAYLYLISGLILGTGMGFTQMMRGAHFMSHNIWTLWVSWCVDLMIYVVLAFLPTLKGKLTLTRNPPKR